MMPMNEAMVITATSLWATCDSSWASTASSSRSSRLLFSRPVVTTRTEVLVFRPVANAFSIGDGAIATRGLGMLASAVSRSTMPCSLAARGPSCGVTSRACAVLSAILSEYQKEPTPRARPNSTAMNTMPPLVIGRGPRTSTRTAMKATNTSPRRNIVRVIRVVSPLSGA